MEKINIAELLKDCPRGMELYSPIFGNVYLDKIRPHLAIVVTTDKKQGDFKEEFIYDGRYGMNGECMLFPSRDKTTWEGFQRPFKDGDIVRYLDTIAIFNGWGDETLFRTYVTTYLHKDSTINVAIPLFGKAIRRETHFATEKEKQKLFDAIKANGYKWNAETKTLEKLIEKTKNSEETKFPSFEPMFKMNGELEYKIPDGYEITEVSKDKIFIKPIKPEYPTVYEECVRIAKNIHGYDIHIDTPVYRELMESFVKLLICRDAYWKIAGELMGLGKSWEHDYLKDANTIRYTIYNTGDEIVKLDGKLYRNYTLCFPTEEMRDAFYENFKELIEQCKELL